MKIDVYYWNSNDDIVLIASLTILGNAKNQK